jgi:hypothetical protein
MGATWVYGNSRHLSASDSPARSLTLTRRMNDVEPIRCRRSVRASRFPQCSHARAAFTSRLLAEFRNDLRTAGGA